MKTGMLRAYIIVAYIILPLKILNNIAFICQTFTQEMSKYIIYKLLESLNLLLKYCHFALEHSNWLIAIRHSSLGQDVKKYCVQIKWQGKCRK